MKAEPNTMKRRLLLVHKFHTSLQGEVMKKLITIIMLFMLVLTVMPQAAFAETRYDSISLEMEFSEGSCGNYKVFSNNNALL